MRADNRAPYIELIDMGLNIAQTFFLILRPKHELVGIFFVVKSRYTAQKLVIATQQYGYHTHSCDL